VLPLCGAAVLRSEGSRDEGRGKRQEDWVGIKQGKGKVCFRFLLLAEPCPSDYAQGQRFFSKNSASSNSEDVDGKGFK
jgi:hypothetical protein